MPTTAVLTATRAVPFPSRRSAPAATADRVLDASALGDHLDRLMRAALALCGSHADAEDLVQEVCLRVLAKPRVVHGSDIAYLHGVLRNTYFSEYRVRARRRTTPVESCDLAEIPAGRGSDPEVVALVHEVHGAIAELTAHYRDAVVAVDVLGLRYAEAGAALGVPEGTIMSRLSRGRAMVARRVGAPATAR
jgi:RNA polymerase sigma-70 factor, ECF subfamily